MHHGPQTTRRDFLRSATVASGSLALLGTGGLPAFARGPQPVDGTTTSGLEILESGYPRAFFYRQAEARANRMRYDRWEETFLPLNGISGKVLPEARPDVVHSTKQLEFFTRFKERHPEKMVMVHYMGLGRIPTHDTDGFFAGHWLYKAGSHLNRPLSADPAETVLHLEDVSNFGIHQGQHGYMNIDIGLCSADAQGNPDWQRAEQLRLVSVDRENNTIEVERGAFGTEALDFPAGSYLAHHEAGGPWGRSTLQTWSYNFATTCPRDAQGRNCVDALVDDLAQKLGPTGALAAFDGIEFDFFNFSLQGDAARGFSPEADADADGVADGGLIDGVNVYGLGTLEFTSKLRNRLPDKLIKTDCSRIARIKVEHQHLRNFADINGIEIEGFIDRGDKEVLGWSQGMNILNFSRQTAGAPAMNHIAYAFREGRNPTYSRFRLIFAAAQLTGAEITGAELPTRGGDRLIPVWDEMWKGTAREPNWLGMPVGPAIYPASDSDDLLRGQGVAWTDRFVESFSGDRVEFRRDTADGEAPRLVIDSTAADSDGTDLDRVTVFTGPTIEVPGPDLVVTLRVRADELPYYPTARYLKVTATPSTGPDDEMASATWVGEDSFDARFYFQEIGPGPVTLTFEAEGYDPVVFEELRAHAGGDVAYREFEHGAVFANPSPHPYTFDIAELFPGASFRRFQGSELQDPETNDASPVSGPLTIGPKDGLAVVRASS